MTLSLLLQILACSCVVLRVYDLLVERSFDLLLSEGVVELSACMSSSGDEDS